MSLKFSQRQVLLFYVESEPQGTSPVPNVESLVLPYRDLNPEPSDWRICEATAALKSMINGSNSIACIYNIYAALYNQHVISPLRNAANPYNIMLVSAGILREFVVFRCIVTVPVLCADIDECESAPCYNRATCLDEVDRYSCVCNAGYTNWRCQTGDDSHSQLAAERRYFLISNWQCSIVLI